MTYHTLSLHNCDSETKYARILSLSKGMKIVIPFDGDCALLAYVSPEDLHGFKGALKTHGIGFTDMKIEVSENDISKYIKNVDKKRIVKVDDMVKVSGYGNAPFRITEVGSTMATATIKLFNYVHTVTEPHSKFSQHKTHEDIMFNPNYVNLNSSDDLCIIDIKLLNTKFNPSTLQQKIYLLIRIKSLMHRGGRVAMVNPSHEFAEIASVFGFPIIKGIVDSHSAVVERSSPLALKTNTIYDINDQHLVRVPMTIEEKFISFLTSKKYNFSAEQIYQHFQDTTRFTKQRREFFRALTDSVEGSIEENPLNIDVLRDWLSSKGLGQVSENLGIYLKTLHE